MGQAPWRCRTHGTPEPSEYRCANDPDPAGWIGRRRGIGIFTDRFGLFGAIACGCPPAEPGMNWDRPAGREPTGLTGRRGGTDEFLGRGGDPAVVASC
jgi:hypothetical protein